MHIYANHWSSSTLNDAEQSNPVARAVGEAVGMKYRRPLVGLLGSSRDIDGSQMMEYGDRERE